MKTSFKTEQLEKYVKVTYVTEYDKLSNRLEYNAERLLSSQEEAKAFIEKATEFEKLIYHCLVDYGYTYKTPLIMLTYMEVIEGISCGLDVRKNKPTSELAHNFVEAYLQKYISATMFCEETIKQVDAAGDEDTYNSDYDRYNKHNELVDEFKLGIRKIKGTDFKVNLESIHNNISNLLDEMLKVVKGNSETENNSDSKKL